jgi:phosphoglycerate dehydrogenase-like enzyme
MSPVNVLVAARWGMNDAAYDRLKALDSRIAVQDVSSSMTTLMGGPRQPQSEDPAERESARRALEAPLRSAEVIYGTARLPGDVREMCPNLKWIHLAGTGVDRLDFEGVMDGSILVTNSRGALGFPIAQAIVMLMLSLAKDVHKLLQQQRAHVWQRYVTQDLDGKTLALIGLGAIGGSLASLGRAFQMRTLATRHSATEHSYDVDGVDEVFPPSQLHDMLSQADFVAITAPLTDETRGLIGKKELAIMKSTSYIFNVGRGPIIDQTALIDSLKNGGIAGAGLDVVEEEPLPGDSELWDLPNVIISPHMAGGTESHGWRVADLFIQNLQRYLEGDELINRLSLGKSY